MNMEGKESGANKNLFWQRMEQGHSLTEAFGMSEADLDPIAGLSASFYQEGRLEPALRLLEGLTALRPERPEYWSALGAVLTALERHEDAVPALSIAVRMNPRDTAAFVNRGECYMGLGDPEKAGKDFESAILLDPKQEDPAANRARQMVFGFARFFEQCSEAGLDTVEIEDEEAS